MDQHRSRDSLQARMDQLQARMDQHRSRSCSPASAASRPATPDRNCQRLTDAEELIRELKAQVEELKFGRYQAQRASEEERGAFYAREQKVLAAEAQELDESPALRCQKALARLLECMTHQELKDPPLEGAKRRGSWSTTSRAACGPFLTLMHELTDEALARRPERPRESAAEKSRTKLGNEMFLILKGRMDKDHWNDQHLDILDRRLKNQLGICGPDEGRRPDQHNRGQKGRHRL